ncbi:MAG: Wzz/FepE/Etk N-terminal domain-containing protein [Rhodobacteraceae bacterium]|nr:Wzz/FepE/Etk N-terminal domain-containing protein [Paracoccaceae bacterium]
MGHIQTLDDLISFLFRRRLLIIAITVLGVALSVLIAKSRPKTYQAAAVIQVLSPVVTEEAVPGAAPTTGSAEMLQIIEQQLTTREALISMMERHGLFADLPGLSLDQKVGLLRNSVSFQQVASAAPQQFGAAPRVSALIINAQLGDGEQAARVANDFAQSILDMGASGQSSRAETNFRFFQEDEARLRQAIEALEDQIATYRNANAAALPGIESARQDELVSVESDLRALDQSLVALTSEQALIAALPNPRATDDRRLAEIEAAITQFQAQRAALADRQATIAAAMSQTPVVERTLRGFERDLQQLQDQYTVVSRRLAEAETDLRIASQQQDERFSLLERAITPEFALGGGAKKLAAAGAVASLALAVAIAFLLDLLRPVVRTEAQLIRELDLRPVISIPELPIGAARNTAPADDPQNYPRLAVYASFLVLVLVVVAVSVT